MGTAKSAPQNPRLQTLSRTTVAIEPGMCKDSGRTTVGIEQEQRVPTTCFWDSKVALGFTKG